VHAEPCSRCDGAGRFESERVALVEVPPGSEEGDELRIAGEGHAGGRNAEPGDLLVTVRIETGPDRRKLRLLAGVTAAGAAAVVVLIVVFLTLD
jgi:DnaJ-class molecular chaperone